MREIERLRRWAGLGGTWEVVERTPARVTVSLRRCDGGEEAELLVSEDADLLGWLGGRTSSGQ